MCGTGFVLNFANLYEIYWIYVHWWYAGNTSVTNAQCLMIAQFQEIYKNTQFNIFLQMSYKYNRFYASSTHIIATM